MPDREALDELRAAWSALQAPEAFDAPDAATTAALMRLREAWHASAPSERLAPPRRLVVRSAVARVVPWISVAAAAAAVFALALFVRELPARSAPKIPAHVVRLERGPALPSPRVHAVTERYTELRSDSVRVLLFSDRPDPTLAPRSDGPAVDVSR
mgnify:CR=1 FL=1